MRTIVALPTFSPQIQQLFKQFGTTEQVEKDRYIFREGDPAEHMFFILSGAVQISKNAESGKEMTLQLCGPQSFIGENSLHCLSVAYTTTAKAMQHCTFIRLPCTLLEQLCEDEPLFMRDYLKWVQIENLKNQSRIRDLLLNGKKGALYSTLIRLANTYGETNADNNTISIHFALTNTQIANLCATSREVINRSLNELKKQGIITFENGYITILDVAYLKRAIACENCPPHICRID